MNKKYALFLSLLITLIIASDFYLFHHITSFNKESVFISRVIDGDTIVLNDSSRVRLLNINSPEKGKSGSYDSFEYLKQYENKTVELVSIGKDKYNRTLGRLYFNNHYLNLDIVKNGYASKFLVQESELKDFVSAEDEAIRLGKGIWEKSTYYGCFDIEIDSKKELVYLKSKCGELNIKGWYIKDESRKIYTFKDIQTETIILHSSKGEDNLPDLFWDSKTSVWNNDRDTAYLFDNTGKIVYYKSYGY